MPGASEQLLEDSQIDSALERASELGAQYADIRLVSLDNNSVAMRDGQLEKSISGVDVGATLRVLADGAWGTYSTTDLSSLVQNVDTTFRLAKSIAQRRPSGQSAIELAEVPIKSDRIDWQPKKDIRDIGLEQRLEMMQNLSQEASDDDRVISTTVGWSDEHIHNELRSTEGMDRCWTWQRSLIHAMVTARDGDSVVSFRTRHGGEGGFDVIEAADLAELGADSRKSVIKLLSAERSPSGSIPLVADRDLTGVYIHEALGHPCEADLVASGDSCLDGKLGVKIGNEIVNVIDDPTIRGGYGAHPVDDEGLDTVEKSLIEDGVLKTYLNHRETAAKFDIEPNAGARAQDGLHRPLVRMSNTLIKAGSHRDLEALLEDIDHGVYACGTRGGQVDTGRGSFQFAAQEAWLIENGELTKPLKDVSVSGMTLEILSKVDGLAEDARLASPGFCGKGQTVPVGDGGPIMRISDALVG